MPLYTLTKPSPLAAEPINDLVLLSTVNFRPLDQATAKEPSILSSSFSNSISISSFLATGDSKATTPFPSKARLNSPSPPANADDMLVLDTSLCFKLASLARKSAVSYTHLTLPTTPYV